MAEYRLLYVEYLDGQINLANCVHILGMQY